MFYALFSAPAQANPPAPSHALEDGYELWLRYRPLPAASQRPLKDRLTGIVLLQTETPSLRAAREELQRGLRGMLGDAPPVHARLRNGSLVLARAEALPASTGLPSRLQTLGDEGYAIQRTRLDGADVTLIAANTDIGLLYGNSS
jgi:alpha-glucuronidase